MKLRESAKKSEAHCIKHAALTCAHAPDKNIAASIKLELGMQMRAPVFKKNALEHKKTLRWVMLKNASLLEKMQAFLLFTNTA